jgi:uncharacterized lipoprotein YmbA
MSSMKTIQILFLAVMALGLSACGKTPSARFYTLSSMTSQSTADHVSKQGKTIIGIGPVNVAAYLDRAEIVTRSSPTTIELASFDRWAEPFEGMIASSLAENISTMLPSVQAIVDPWPEANIDYQLVIKIKQFDSDNDGNIQLHASWGILQYSTRKISSVTESKISVPGSTGDYDAITINMSRALVNLSKEIAAELKNIEKY